MNPLIQGHSGTTPEMSQNEFSKNQGTNEDDSQSDPHPEAGIFGNQTMRNSGQKDRRDKYCDKEVGCEKEKGHLNTQDEAPQLFSAENRCFRDFIYFSADQRSFRMSFIKLALISAVSELFSADFLWNIADSELKSADIIWNSSETLIFQSKKTHFFLHKIDLILKKSYSELISGSSKIFR